MDYLKEEIRTAKIFTEKLQEDDPKYAKDRYQKWIDEANEKIKSYIKAIKVLKEKDI